MHRTHFEKDKCPNLKTIRNCLVGSHYCGYPSYKTRDTRVSIQKSGISLHKGYVVPYNPFLLMRYQGHINVEYCNKSNAIKYLFKYVNKGPDHSNVEITSDTS